MDLHPGTSNNYFDSMLLLKEYGLSLRINLLHNKASLYLDQFKESTCSFFSAQASGTAIEPDYLKFQGGILTANFGSFGEASVKIQFHHNFVIFHVISCSQKIERLYFGGVYCPECGHGYSSAGMALNLHTNSDDLLSVNSVLRASSFCEFGIEGAAFAVILCPTSSLCSVMREVTSNYTEDIPWSSKGGAYAIDHPDIRCSYLLNSTGINESDIESWILTAKNFGASQIDFHGGSSFRFGDFKLNPKCFPDGRRSFANIIARLHQEGIQSGLHTYAQFIDPQSEYVTPIPHPQLGGHPYTLSQSVDTICTSIPTLESTANVSTLTGFFVRNSVHLMIDQEIIKFNAVGKNEFLSCERGALGTTPAPHKKGATVKHLFSVFGLFAPDGDSDLYLEIARRTAEMYNELDFDMIYLDAIDGSDIFAGEEKAWYYASKFVAEIMRHVMRPPILEMSRMWHHFWYFRSRMGAWDHSVRAHKFLLREHDRSNLNVRAKTTLPQNFGWWNYGQINPDHPVQVRRMFIDDYEFLGSRALKNDWSMSFFTRKGTLNDEMNRFAQTIGTYNRLRMSNSCLDWSSIGDSEVILSSGNLLPIIYQKRRFVSNAKPQRITIPEGEILRRLRIENRPCPAAADHYPLLISSEDANDIRLLTSTNMTASLTSGRDDIQGLCLSASQNGTIGYARLEKIFPEGLNIFATPGLRIMIYGDGKGEKLDIQLKSPKHMLGGVCDRIIDVDFVGWRCFDLIESDAERTGENIWPFSGGGHYNAADHDPVFKIAQDTELSQYEWHPSSTDVDLYHVTRENVDFHSIYSISVWMNNMLDGETYSVIIGEISAFPIQQNALTELCLRIDNTTYRFDGSLPKNSYVEYDDGTWYGYDADGNLLTDIIYPDIPYGITAGSTIDAEACGEYGLELTVGTCHSNSAQK